MIGIVREADKDPSPDLAIGDFLGERQFPIAGSLVHDAVRESPDLENIPVQLAAVPLVRVDTLASSRSDFIQHGDEFFRIRPIGRRGMPTEHKTVPTVRGGVDFVAVIRPIPFAQPSRVGIVRVADGHIRRVTGIFLAIFGQHIENLDRTPCGRNDAGIDDGSFAHQKSPAF